MTKQYILKIREQILVAKIKKQLDELATVFWYDSTIVEKKLKQRFNGDQFLVYIQKSTFRGNKKTTFNGVVRWTSPSGMNYIIESRQCPLQ